MKSAGFMTFLQPLSVISGGKKRKNKATWTSYPDNPFLLICKPKAETAGSMCCKKWNKSRSGSSERHPTVLVRTKHTHAGYEI